MIIFAACFIAASALAFYAGMRFMRRAVIARFVAFFERYYPAISAEQPDEWREAYCRGARELFDGMMAEFGFKIKG